MLGSFVSVVGPFVEVMIGSFNLAEVTVGLTESGVGSVGLTEVVVGSVAWAEFFGVVVCIISSGFVHWVRVALAAVKMGAVVTAEVVPLDIKSTEIMTRADVTFEIGQVTIGARILSPIAWLRHNTNHTHNIPRSYFTHGHVWVQPLSKEWK